MTIAKICHRFFSSHSNIKDFSRQQRQDDGFCYLHIPIKSGSQIKHETQQLKTGL